MYNSFGMTDAPSLGKGYLRRSEICRIDPHPWLRRGRLGVVAALFTFAVAVSGMPGFADNLQELAVNPAGGRQRLGWHAVSGGTRPKRGAIWD